MQHDPIYKQTFKKAERLTNRKAISKLFAKGSSFYIFPVRVVWMPVIFDNKYPARVVFSVSRKEFRKAHDRNKIKRLLREGYRKNKGILYESLNNSNKQCALAFVYSANKIVSYDKLESIIIIILQRLIKEYEKDIG